MDERADVSPTQMPIDSKMAAQSGDSPHAYAVVWVSPQPHTTLCMDVTGMVECKKPDSHIHLRCSIMYKNRSAMWLHVRTVFTQRGT